MDSLTVATRVRTALQLTVQSSLFGVSVTPMRVGEVTHFRVLLTFKFGAVPGVTTLRGLELELRDWVAERDPRATVDVWFQDLTGRLRPAAKAEATAYSWPDTVQTIGDEG